LNPYSQVTFETNRYSVPVETARAHLTLKAYPFRIEVWDETRLLTTHPRSYQRDQDLFDPLHYLALLEHRPGPLNMPARCASGAKRGRRCMSNCSPICAAVSQSTAACANSC
jgi:hypothetical protein